MEIKDNVFVITGGGNGIGRETVLQMLQKGAKIFAIDKSDKGLKETKEIAKAFAKNLAIKVCDITDKPAVEALPEEVIKKFGKIDGLLNIAGIIQPFVYVNDIDYDKIDLVMKVNYFGTVYMTKTFLPYLQKNNTASCICNVSSMAGFMPYPGQAIYSSSKAAVRLFTEALYAELKDTNIRVTSILPGAINTNIAQNSGIKTHSTEGKSHKMTSAPKAASMIVEGIEKAKFQVLIGSDCKTLNFLYRLNPKNALDMVAKKMRDLLIKK